MWQYPARLSVQLKGALVVLGVPAIVAGCASATLFGFPAEQGDSVAGRQAFLDHRCHQCHSIADERLPPLAGADRPILELGGPTSVVRSYADLTTSIINPNHAISERVPRPQQLLKTEIPVESPMPMPSLDTHDGTSTHRHRRLPRFKYRLMIDDYE
jgi:hypothetical protein